eukprot:JZ552236.1.p1 GENE.JZ552236.1~~JZ552236.1.p1  ORF type:complete len:214 (+),score=17.38 JZ552236.1:33-644(+)
MDYNGGLVLAMAGKNCVAIAADRRLGVRSMQTVAMNFDRVFKMHDKIYVGLPGLATDTQTVHEKLVFRNNLFQLRENRVIDPKAFAHMTANMLYERRFAPYFVEPIIAGLSGPENKPFICGMDLLGAICEPRDFVVAGSMHETVHGIAETMWKPDMEPEELFEVISQCLMNAFDRIAITGWGGIVYIVTPTETKKYELLTRID